MIGHLLNSTVTVYRPGYTSDGAGGRTKTFTQTGTVRAKVGQPFSQELMAAGQLGAHLTHVVHVAHGADVQRGDELDVGEGRRLRVLDAIHDSRLTYTRLDCQAVQGE